MNFHLIIVRPLSTRSIQIKKLLRTHKPLAQFVIQKAHSFKVFVFLPLSISYAKEI